MASNMAEDHRETLRLLEAKKGEYDLNAIIQSLDTIQEPLDAILRIRDTREKRQREEERRRNQVRALERQLAQRQEAAAQEAAAAAGAEDGADADHEAMIPTVVEEEEEPSRWEPLPALLPQQPLPPLDLSPLADLLGPLLPAFSSSSASQHLSTSPQAWALLQQLLSSQQLFLAAAGGGGWAGW
ncbi:hypothetical protein Agub_g1414, partial [Astrephomene gubernaculifera]